MFKSTATKRRVKIQSFYYIFIYVVLFVQMNRLDEWREGGETDGYQVY